MPRFVVSIDSLPPRGNTEIEWSHDIAERRDQVREALRNFFGDELIYNESPVASILNLEGSKMQIILVRQKLRTKLNGAGKVINP
jgi:hypothetical protein